MGVVIFWAIISIAAMVGDIITDSFFLSGFAVGSIAAILARFQGFNFAVQIAVLIAASTGAALGEYLWLRPLVKKLSTRTCLREGKKTKLHVLRVENWK